MHKQLEEICSRVDSDLLAGVKPDDIFAGYTQHLPVQYQDFSREYTALSSSYRSEAQRFRDEANERKKASVRYGYWAGFGVVSALTLENNYQRAGFIATLCIATAIVDKLTKKTANLGWTFLGTVLGALYNPDYRGVIVGTSLGLGVSTIRAVQKKRVRKKELEAKLLMLKEEFEQEKSVLFSKTAMDVMSWFSVPAPKKSLFDKK